MSLDYHEPVERWPEHRGPSMRPPSRARTRVTVAVVALAVGFLVGVQAQEGAEDRISRLAEERPEDLTRILAELNAEADDLARQASSLRVRVLRYQDTTSGSRVALRDARKTLADLRVLSGAVGAVGPGVSVRVQDRDASVGWELLLDVIQELRDAGAEAVAMAGRRVVASTWLGPAEDGVTVDGETVGPPYEIEAIGPAAGMREALEIPGGPLTVVAAQPGVTVNVVAEDEIEVPALQRRISFEYARPAQ